MFFPAQVTLGGRPYRCFWILDFGLSQMLEWASWDHPAPSGLWATQEYALYQINFIFSQESKFRSSKSRKGKKTTQGLGAQEGGLPVCPTSSLAFEHVPSNSWTF